MGWKVNASLLSSAKTDWQTPDEVLDLVRKVGPIDLDPCTTADNPTGAARFFVKGDNGLKQNWGECIGDNELIFVNPPYGRSIGRWTEKCRREAHRRNRIIALVPDRTDTAWFNDALDSADAACLWRGRITFRGAPAPAPFPSALIYWGDCVSLFANAFRSRGRILAGGK